MLSCWRRCWRGGWHCGVGRAELDRVCHVSLRGTQSRIMRNVKSECVDLLACVQGSNRRAGRDVGAGLCLDPGQHGGEPCHRLVCLPPCLLPACNVLCCFATESLQL